MKAVELLDQLNAIDVHLSLDGDTLPAKSPSGVMIQTLVHEINLHEPELIDFVERETNEPTMCAHLLPFNAVKSSDPQRRGWVESTWRHCGMILGFKDIEA